MRRIEVVASGQHDSDFGRVAVGVAAAAGTVLIWAFWIVGTRVAVTGKLEPIVLGLLRYSMPAILLAPVWWRLGLKPKGVSWPMLVALMGTGAPFFLLVASGMRFAPAADAAPLLPGTLPLIVAALSWLVFKERIGFWRVIGFGLILCGVLAIGGRGLVHFETGAWRGHLLFLSGVSYFACFTLALRRSGLNALEAAAVTGILSFLMLLPFAYGPLVSHIDAGHWRDLVVQLVLQGILSGIAAIVLYGMAVNRLGASQAAAVTGLTPAVAALLAVPVLAEIPDLAAILGIAATGLGVGLASGIFERPKRRSLLPIAAPPPRG